MTHFGRCRAAPCAFAIIDLVSRKWLATLLSAEEASTQVGVVVTGALEAEGLMELVAAGQDGRVDLAKTTPAGRCCWRCPTFKLGVPWIADRPAGGARILGDRRLPIVVG